jgi:hypothetical protein
VDDPESLRRWLSSIVTAADEVRRQHLQPAKTPEVGENDPLASVGGAELAVHSLLYKVAGHSPNDNLLSTTGDHKEVLPGRTWVINSTPERDDLGKFRWWISVCLVRRRPGIFAMFRAAGG